jgi:hypothetical protein
MNTSKVKYFLMFMGYPRSGHTLVASMLNAHPSVVCSNQMFIIQDVDKKNLEGLLSTIETGSSAGYWKPEVKIASPPKTDLYVVGDKTGHRTVEYLIDNKEQLDNLKKIIPWPIKWVHVVRNPYDCMATWTKKNVDNKKKQGIRTPVEEEFKLAFAKFKALNEKITGLKKTEDVLTLLHEKVIVNKDHTMQQLCNFLDIEKTGEWRNSVVKTLWKKARITRRQISWTPFMKNSVMNYVVKKYPWMKGYHHGFGG